MAASNVIYFAVLPSFAANLVTSKIQFNISNVAIRSKSFDVVKMKRGRRGKWKYIPDVYSDVYL